MFGGHPKLVPLLALLPILVGAESGAAQGPGVLQVHRLPPGGEASFRLDGLLTESFWDAAPALNTFIQQEPAEGDPASERTEVRVVYDDENLYMGALIFDDPAGILAFQKARDAMAQAEKLLDLKHGKSAELADSIIHAAEAIEKAAEATRPALANIKDLTAEDSTTIYTLNTMLKEVASAARSIRTLTDYLARHPEALISGKGGGKGR